MNNGYLLFGTIVNAKVSKITLFTILLVYFFTNYFRLIMETIDLKAFREANNLTQLEVADYLEVQKAFISAVENGRSKLPRKKFTLLLNNPHGWDVSMLTQSKIGEPVHTQDDILIAELRAQIERLQSKVDYLNQELGEKNALIKMMRQGGSNSVHNAEDSSSANVG